MPDNLSISIGIDTAKLRADAAIVREELRKINTEVKNAAKAGDVAGVQASAAQQDRAIRQLAEINQQLRANTAVKRENTVATQEATVATEKEAVSTRELGLELGHLAHVVGLPIEGIKALRFGFAALVGGEVIRGLKDITERIAAIGRVSKETGFNPATVQQWTIAVEKAGGTADDATASLKKLGAAFLDARGRASAERFLPVGVHGEEDPFKALNIDVLKFEQGARGLDRFLQEIARSLVNLNKSGKVDEANWRSVQILGKTYRELASAIEAAASGDLSKITAAITTEDIENVHKYEQALIGLANAWNALLAGLTETGAFQDVIHFVNDLTKGIADSVKQLAALTWWVKGLASYYGLADKPTSGPPADSGITPMTQAITPMGEAAGGYIRGPGSGTSDSILARLSNGEFVVNAASVRRVGVGFMHGLNNFAAGGLVSTPPMRFAQGGLAVASTDGRAVHLHLGSQSFALSGSGSVVDSLVSEAHAQQMRSAGVKPSWFAARPGG